MISEGISSQAFYCNYAYRVAIICFEFGVVKNFILWLIWTKLLPLNFRERKQTSACPFKPGVGLFEQATTCCKQAAACFKVAYAYSEGTIASFFKF